MNAPMSPSKTGTVAILGLVIALVVLLAIPYLPLQSPSRARPPANLVKCQHSLRMIGQAYQSYLKDFHAPPLDLVTLAEMQDLEFHWLACQVTYPARPDSNLSIPQLAVAARAKPLKYVGYEYIHRTTPAGPDEIVAYDRLTNHAGHSDIPSDINVLFGDGRVERWKVADLKKKLVEVAKP